MAYLQGWFNDLGSRLSAAVPSQLVSAPDHQTAAAVLEPERAPAGERVSFSFCHVGGGQNCVVDGDTIWLHGEKIRIADIDTPETHDYQCPGEKALGDRATVRLRDLLQAGSVSLGSIDRDEDQYGRKLRIVMVDGESVGEALVDEGLARWYEGGRRPWC
ncbi:MAG: thermonuclease family protein [Sphingopyxis sp.]|nr:thermonuclease family protein [Sphingopyxis sp.]